MSLSSMTGFARSEGALDAWTWAIEIRSVNGRNLEVRFRGPPGLDNLERQSREAAQARFQRGQISIAVQARQDAAHAQVRVNLEAVGRYLALGEALVAAGRARPPSVDGLLALPGVIEAPAADQDPERRLALEAAMAGSIGEALDSLKAARREEGVSLAVVLGGFLAAIEALLAVAEAQAEAQPVLLRDRFARRLTELAGEAAGADRILQEASALALRADVREELDRLASHVVAARGLLEQPGARGRRLDFLTQEFMREANTLCAKAATPGLTAIGLELKAIVDRFREQSQNVE